MLTMARIAALTRGSLYLANMFIAGLTTDSPLACRLALASMGIAYIGEIALQVDLDDRQSQSARQGARMVASVSFVASAAAGIIAGLCLL